MDVAAKSHQGRTTRLLLLTILAFLAACNPAELLPPDARLPDGSTYSGDISNGLFHGDGEQVFVSGLVYRGQFQDGYWHGIGVLESPEGWRYEGSFEKGVMSGPGVLEDETSRYEGEFKNGNYHGKGRLAFDNDVYLGEFKNGKLIEGRHIASYGTYQGEFKNWLYHGEGTYAYVDEHEDAAQMSGTWERGEFIDYQEVAPDELPEPEVMFRTEQILAEDHARLQRQIASLAGEQPGKADAYFLAVGGDGTESVFKRDIQVAKTGLQQRFDVENRSVMLLNHRDYASLPLATRPSIETALAALDQRMNPDEDLLVVHLVSHGARSGELILQQPGVELPDLTPGDFAAMLEPLNVQRKLLVVSACFSGQWIEQLKNTNTWIMTSAREDRTSFGCGDDSEMTWFTRAVYQDVGLSPANPDAMFEQIEEQIRAWEKEIGMDEEQWSYPQVFIGDGMRQWLATQ